jgi:hypothetical protein
LFIVKEQNAEEKDKSRNAVKHPAFMNEKRKRKSSFKK